MVELLRYEMMTKNGCKICRKATVFKRTRYQLKMGAPFYGERTGVRVYILDEWDDFLDSCKKLF